MSLEVIGAGFGRTGTRSLKEALEVLGLGPCHHMEEVFAHPEQVAHWQAVVAGDEVEWPSVFAGYRAQVDGPGAHSWRELAAAFPAARVVLSVRPEQPWWSSFSATIGPLLQTFREHELPPHIQDMMVVGERMIAVQTFGCAVDDKEGVLAAYRRHTEQVRATIPPERLLVFDVAEGWAPLCAFLGVAVPDVAFPRRDSQTEFWDTVRGGPH